MSDYYIEKDGVPVIAPDGARSFPSMEERRVAYDDLGHARVSTVFLSLDHGYGDGPPVLYETMVFDERPPSVCPTCGQTTRNDDGDSERYCTREEALTGHARYVEKWRALS
jgi:hypothetical protein